MSYCSLTKMSHLVSISTPTVCAYFLLLSLILKLLLTLANVLAEPQCKRILCRILCMLKKLLKLPFIDNIRNVMKL